MPSELPIACTLIATDLHERLAEMAAIGRAALIGAERDGTRAVLRFRPVDETRRRLEAVVAAEAECCAFLDMALRNEEAAVVLTIDAPPGAEPVLDDLAAAFAAQSSQ